MRRLLRILLNTATVLSLVLCAATMAAWVRSYRANDFVRWSMANPRLELFFETYRGGLFAGFYKPVGTSGALRPPGRWNRPAMSYTQMRGPQGTLFNKFGFALQYAQNNAHSLETRYVACPYWFILLLTAILPGAPLAGWRRRRRARRLSMSAGLCQHCGYDCRATPDRCPECGAAGVTSPPISA